MALTLESMLAPISEDNPVGPDMSYDNERQQIEQAFEVNDTGEEGEGEDKDWRAILRMIESQFAQTKDVWLPVYMCRAGARSGSLETVVLGAQGLTGLFEQYWDTVHPQLEELGLAGRKAPCDSLAARRDFLLPLEKVVLVRHPRLGAFSGQDIDRFRSDRESAEGYGMFRAALEELGNDALNEALASVAAIDEALRRADQIFTSNAAGDVSPNFSPAYATLSMLKTGLQAFLTGDEAVAEVGADALDGGTGGGGGGGQRGVGRIESNDDVIKALDAIGDYYRRTQPSHPLPLLLNRARSWVGLDFLGLMSEIAPEAVFTAQQLLNKREE